MCAPNPTFQCLRKQAVCMSSFLNALVWAPSLHYITPSILLPLP